MIKYLFTLPLFWLPILTQAQGVTDIYEQEDTVNVERYDDQKLRPLVGSTSTVPFFHHTQRRFWYTWSEAGGKPEYKAWDAKKGKYKLASTAHFDDFKFKAIMPYGTSPDSLYRLSEDSAHNLVLENLKSGLSSVLTHDGAEGYSFEIIDVAWLDGGKFLIPRKDKRGVRTFALVYSLHTSPMSYSYDYEIPGDTIVERVDYFLGDLQAGSLQKVDVTHWPCQEIKPQQANGVTDRIFFWRNKRTRDMAELCTIDTAGRLKVIITEEAKPRINPDMFSCKVVNGGRDIFIWSDRTGWGHYYHYDSAGRLLNAVTSGHWTSGRIVSIDEQRRQIYFMGYGREAGRNPNYSFAYRVGFDGKGLKLLTPEDATHNVFVDTTHDLVVDTYSRIDLPPTLCVRNGQGKLLDVLEKTDISQLTAYGWKCPEQFTVKAADDSTTLYGVMWKPYNFDPARKYPVISQVYPGPFTETVWNEFTVFDRYHNAALAQRGFIVVVFGHRGSSPYRSKAYNVYGYGNLRDYALADDKAGLEHLARQYPFIDLSRVGIVGHSGGAMMAAAALMTYPDFYKAAVASSGNYDNTIYNRFWGETYQGIGDDGHFSVKTCMELASRLKGHLMLVTGDADRNVHPAHTQRMAEALIQANKDFDLLILPGQEHHYDARHQQYFERRKRDFFCKWLKQQTD